MQPADTTTGGKACPALTQARACGTAACPEDCDFAPWGEWAACDYDCPEGVRGGTYVEVRGVARGLRLMASRYFIATASPSAVEFDGFIIGG